MYKILAKRQLNSVVKLMEVEAPYVARKCEPGQFIIVRIDENGERIPLTIADYNRDKKSVTIIFQELGFSTKLLGKKEVGEYLHDFAGPLGVPTKLEKKTKVLGIGGGVGAAPLYPQIRKLKELGTNVDVVLGGRTDELVILRDEYKTISNNIYYATNDGSLGIQGFVTDVLKDLVENKGEKYDEVIAIGPLVMMKAVVDLTKQYNIPTAVSLNPIMIDGTGMCGGCRVTVGGETKFACVDGPDFNGFDVDFEEAMRRQNMYKKQEEAHVCKVGLN